MSRSTGRATTPSGNHAVTVCTIAKPLKNSRVGILELVFVNQQLPGIHCPPKRNDAGSASGVPPPNRPPLCPAPALCCRRLMLLLVRHGIAAAPRRTGVISTGMADSYHIRESGFGSTEIIVALTFFPSGIYPMTQKRPVRPKALSNSIKTSRCLQTLAAFSQFPV